VLGRVVVDLVGMQQRGRECSRDSRRGLLPAAPHRRRWCHLFSDGREDVETIGHNMNCGYFVST
jgi:hypothetical protein